MRRIPASDFAGDDGTADPRLTAALDSGDHGAVLAALSATRLLVPVVAMLGEDKSSDMAVVLLTGRDGRQALLAFTCTESLALWQSDARPMPAATRLVATAAVQEGAAAIVLDVAGPRTVVIETDDVRRLAAGDKVVRLDDGTHAWLETPPA